MKRLIGGTGGRWAPGIGSTRGPARRGRRPAGPARRGFLRAIGVGAAAVAVGAGWRLPPAPVRAQAAALSGEELPAPPASLSSRQMADAARALLAGLDADQLALVQYASVADQARTQWSNLPAQNVPRPGISLGEMSESQRVLLHTLLRASTSSQGYHSIFGAVQAEEELGQQQPNREFGGANFYTSIFGNPDDAEWAWMLTGHHMTASFTVAGDRTAFTPLFLGSQPYQFTSGLYAGWQALSHEVTRGWELLNALSDSQLAGVVVSSEIPGDVVAGPGQQNAITEFEGIPASALEPGQQHLLWLLVQQWVCDVDFDAAGAQLALIRESWPDAPYFSWRGPTDDPSGQFYYRVHGPRMLIEFETQQGPLSGQGGGHVHAIVRDPENDYGSDWLGVQYEEPEAQQMSPGGAPPGSPPGP